MPRTTSVTVGTGSGATPVSAAFGAWTGFDQVNSSESYDTRVARVTALLGGRMASQRYFQLGTFTNWPQYYGTNLRCTLSITQDPISVANGTLDTQILAWLRALPFGQGAPIFDVCLNHEPDLSVPTGSNQVTGWRHFSDLVQTVKAEGHTNLRRTPIFAGYTLTLGTDAWLPWYPGDSYVDVIGWDCYFNSGTRSTVAGCLGVPYQKCVDHGKPMIIPEVGLVNPQSNGLVLTEAMRTQLVTDSVAFITNNNVEAAMWFESNKTDGDWRLAPHPGALAAWKQAVINSLL